MSSGRGIAGDISVMSVADVLIWLGNRERTGTLTISQDAVVKDIRVERGHAVRVTSNSPREDLGQFLLNFGLVTPEAIEAAVLAGHNTKVRLGRVLVLGSVVEEAEVRRVLEHQIREAVLDTVRWDVGEFQFVPDEAGPQKSEVPVALSMLTLHRLAAARAPHWAAFHLAFPRLDVRLKIDEAAVPGGADPVRDHILALIRAGATVEAVLQQLLMMEYELYARMYELIRAGALRTIEMHAPPPSISPGEIELDLGDAGSEELTLPRVRAPSARSPISAVITAQIPTTGHPTGAAPAAKPKREPPPRITSGLIPPPVPTPIPSPPPGPMLPFRTRTPRPTTAPAQAIPMSMGSHPAAEALDVPPHLSAAALRAQPFDAPPLPAFGGGTAPTLRVPAWPTPPLGSVTTAHPGARPLGASAVASQHAATGAVVTSAPDVPLTSRTPPPAPGSAIASSDMVTAVPHLRGPLEEALRQRTSTRERYILKRIDGARTVGEILQIVPMTDREVLDVLRGLAASGLIRF